MEKQEFLTLLLAMGSDIITLEKCLALPAKTELDNTLKSHIPLGENALERLLHKCAKRNV